jgi:hypothetical protein
MGQKKTIEGGVLKSLGERSFWVFSSCVIFLGKGRRGMKSLDRWWKGGEWIGFLGYFEK